MKGYTKLLDEILKEKCNNNYETLYKVVFADSLQSCNIDLELTEEQEDYIIDRAYNLWLDYTDYQFDDAILKVLTDIRDAGGIDDYKKQQGGG